MSDEPNSDMPEPVELCRDGAVILHLDGRPPIRWRPMRVLEFREMRRRAAELDATQVALAAKYDEAAAAAQVDPTLPTPEAPDFTELTIPIIAYIDATLGDGTLGEPDEWPLWLAGLSLFADMMAHWAENPLARGRR